MIQLFLLLIGSLLLAGCSSAEGGNHPQEPGSPPYEGPELVAGLETIESPTLQHWVNVRIQVPTGGYALTHDRTTREPDSTRVYLTLTSPGPEEMVTMALETKTARVDLGAMTGRKVEVLVSQVQRGVETATPAVPCRAALLEVGR